MIKENQHLKAHRFSLCALGGEGHHLLDLLAVKTLIPFQDIVDGCTLLQVFKNGGNGKSGSTKKDLVGFATGTKKRPASLASLWFSQACKDFYLQFPVHSPTGPEKHGLRVVKKLSLPPVMPLSSISPAGLAGIFASSAGLRLIT